VMQQGESIGVRELRGLLPHYFKGIPGATHLRGHIATPKVNTLQDIEDVLDQAEAWHGSFRKDDEI
jgi:tRNA-dihydrouridine synthase